MSIWTIRAKWVFPVDGPPIQDGVVTIDGERIVKVEARNSNPVDVDAGNCAIIPGLVNAHTHLDLTGMRGLAPPSSDFTGWLRQVIAFRGQRSPEQVQADIREGLLASLRAGVTLLGDISSDGTSWDILKDAAVRAVVFREIIGLPKDRQAAATLTAQTWFSDHPSTPTCRAALSPHAPYSVRIDLLEVAASLCEQFKAPLAIHVAESAEEIELLRHQTGPFVTFLKDLGVWDPVGLAQGTRSVLRLCARAPSRLLIHANYLTSLNSIPRNACVVYCPRTHAAFGHPPHPFRKFMEKGVRIALGTDSLASNPDLDLLAEARFLAKAYPDFSGESLLRMMTINGAEALRWHDETGSLSPDKSADLVVLPLPERDERDPHRLLFDSMLPVRSVLFRGRWVHGDPLRP